MRSPEHLAVGQADSWCAAVAAGLDELVSQLRWLAEAIAQSWPDDRGRAWSERVSQLHRTLGQDATAAAELQRALTRLVEGRAAVQGAGAQRPGVRLGGTENERADDERGVRVAQLPDSVDAPG